MTLTWVAFISPDKWKSLRAELEDNQLSMAYSHGVASNKNTGYRLINQYFPDTSKLIVSIFYPGKPDYIIQIKSFLDRLFETVGTVHSVTG